MKKIKQQPSYRFKTDSFETALGFKLTYKKSEESQWSYKIGDCGGIFDTQNGVLSSPSYPDTYPGSKDCVYTISQPVGNVIVLKFASFDIYGYGYNCAYGDSLEVRDGISNDSPLLGRLCRREIPVPIQTSQNKLWMK